MSSQPFSRSVTSSQSGVHRRLAAVVDTHRQHAWRAPLHSPSVAAFHALQELVAADARPLVLDSGCGTGESTRLIARALPHSLVIGVDKSRVRLARTGARNFPHREGNVVWLRAELSTFWRLAVQAGWRLHRHFLLYPNPWPKPSHLRRRWHGHPVFPEMLRLGGQLEMRCNWKPYAQEFAAAVRRVLGVDVQPVPVGESPVSSPFERKYRASGHALYSLSVCCDDGAV